MTNGRNHPLRNALLLVGAGLTISLLTLLALAMLVLAASGVLTTPPGAWTVSLQLFPGVDLRLSVPGVARAISSPRLLPLLDGRSLQTRFGRMHLARDGAQLTIRCAPCRLDDARLAAQPLIVDSALLTLARRDAQTLAGSLSSGDIRVDFEAKLTADHVQIDWQLPVTQLAALYRFAASIVPEHAVAQIDGSLAARGQLRLPQLQARTRLDIDGFAVAGLGTEALAGGRVTHACVGADGVPQARVVEPGAGLWISPRGSGALLAHAVLAAEDQRFDAHQGYDPEEIAQVIADIDIDGGDVTRGASTITQQLARMIYTGAERSVARKLRELLYAVEMERTVGKALILGLYLNTVDWGPGICGGRAAALAYFDKQPYQLTPLEAAWLAASLRNPHRAFDSEFAVGRPDRARATQVLMQMRDLPRHDRRIWAARSLKFASGPGVPAPSRALAQR